MIIVGSRCGGFDFFAKKEGTDNFIWLGPEKDSDLDCFCDKPISSNEFQIERFGSENEFFNRVNKNGFHKFYKYPFPYLVDGKLNIPENKNFLSHSIKKKIRSHTNIFKHNGTTYLIYDKNGEYVTEIKFDFIWRSLA